MVADLKSADELAGDCAVGRPLLFPILFIYFLGYYEYYSPVNISIKKGPTLQKVM
jgi:hypothetical protein